MVVSRIVLTGLAVALMATAPVRASSLMPDFNASHAAEQTLARDGDFDGDGRRDALYLADEPETGRVAVHIRLNMASGARDFRVTSLDMVVDSALDLHVVGPGAYAGDCGNFTAACAGIIADHDSLILGLDSGASVLMHWQGDHFETDFVHSDEAALARALSALYAVNP